MKKASGKQVNTFLSILLNNANPDLMDGEILQESLIKNPNWAVEQFTRWINNGGRLVSSSSPVAQLSDQFNPATFEGLGEGWTIWKGLVDGKGLEGELEVYEPADLKELNASDMLFEHFLIDNPDPKNREDVIAGETKLDRVKGSKKILLGGRSFLALLNDYRGNKENSALEWLRKNRGVTWMDFPGLLLRYPDGYRCMLYLYFHGEIWDWHCIWLGLDWYRGYPSALLASIKKQSLDS